MSTRTLTTTLPSGTLYVSGTVNGVATTWTNTEGQTWETVAERAPDDVYVVVLTIISQSGTSSETTFTLYYGLHLVTDRTKADVERVRYLSGLFDPVNGFTGTTEELAEWDSGLKGSYNTSDLNRVGAAMNYVAARLRSAGYAVNISPKIDWTESDIPTDEQMRRYLSDLSELRGQLSQAPTTPDCPPDMVNLTWQEANDIERILQDTDAILTNIIAGMFYSGELYCGEA